MHFTGTTLTDKLGSLSHALALRVQVIGGWKASPNCFSSMVVGVPALRGFSDAMFEFIEE